MNKIHRIIWSTAHNAWVVCSEISKTHGKSSSTTRKLLAAAIILPASAIAADNTLPTGGQITAGQGNFTQHSDTLTINQHSQHLSADWQSFNIGADATVNFQQPNSSAVAINRVTGQDPSRIFGNLNANGQVFLENHNGIVFGQNAQLNVGGLIATTQAITADGNDQYRLNGNSNGSINNFGHITAQNGGTVALIAPAVDNSGSITAQNGNVRLTGAEAVTLKLQDGSLTDYRIERGALDALVNNGGAIVADGGIVHLTAEGKGELRKAAVNHSGSIEANTLTRNDKGEIVLLADMKGGETNVSGSLQAQGSDYNDGGFIEASAAMVNITDSANVSTSSENGIAGNFLIDPYDFIITDTASEGNITGNALGTLLNNGNVTLQTEAENGGSNCDTSSECRGNKNIGNGNIFVNDDVTWTEGNRLTLEATGNIYINKTINADHADASVKLHYGKLTSGTDYHFGPDGKIIFNADVGGKKAFITQNDNDPEIKYTVITALGSETDKTDAAAINSLQGIAETSKLGGYYALGRDINADTTQSWNTNQGFTPIGEVISLRGHPRRSTPAFSGKFHGLGNKIIDLHVKRPTTISGYSYPEEQNGLFGTVKNGELRDINMSNANVQGFYNVGTIAGIMKDSTLHNSSASGVVTGDYPAGGLVGRSIRSHITNSKSEVIVTARSNGGGLIGRLEDNSSLTDSFATGNITGDGRLGGLVGYISDSKIEKGYAEGNITGADEFIGGLIGEAAGPNTITNVYARGDIQGKENVGGLIGYMHGHNDILNAYATGSVTATKSSGATGGLIGEASNYISSNPNSIKQSYWDKDTTQQTVMCGSISGTATGCADTNALPTSDMQEPTTFRNAHWGDAIWLLKSGEYPTFKHVGPNAQVQPLSTNYADPASSSPTGGSPTGGGTSGSGSSSSGSSSNGSSQPSSSVGGNGNVGHGSSTVSTGHAGSNGNNTGGTSNSGTQQSTQAQDNAHGHLCIAATATEPRRCFTL